MDHPLSSPDRRPAPEGGRSALRRRGRRLAAAGLTLLVLGCSPADVERTAATAPAAARQSDAPPPARAPRSAPPTTAPSPAPSRSPSGVVMPATGGDGDSWRDTAGREYRLGLIDTPETDECFGSEATRERKALTASGFSADVYSTDRYGRSVAVVRTADGRDVNVHLARYGFADDRYLAPFRSENPQLAERLVAAFAAARSERQGLWAACADREQPTVPSRAAPAAPTAAPRATVPAAAVGGSSGRTCHPDYTTCLPVQGDGSGRGAPNDVDCGSVDGAVELRRPGTDPYRLDADRDGVGCDS